jgi:hypothetical protein
VNHGAMTHDSHAHDAHDHDAHQLDAHQHDAHQHDAHAGRSVAMFRDSSGSRAKHLLHCFFSLGSCFAVSARSMKQSIVSSRHVRSIALAMPPFPSHAS